MPNALLAPCPFCEFVPSKIQKRLSGFYVYCGRCKARGPLMEEQEEARVAWKETRGVLRSILSYTNDLELYRDDTYSALNFRYPEEEDPCEEES